jgi:hypothetical protein
VGVQTIVYASSHRWHVLAGEAYRRAVTREVRGAFNLAADPVLDAAQLAELLGARIFRVPTAALRAALATA